MKLLLAVATGLLAASLMASPASAHAVLVETDPVDGSELPVSPSVVTLVFNEPVDHPVAAVQVFDSSGVRVDRGNAGHGSGPEELQVSVPELAHGAYVVTWRAISADSHPVGGAFVFEVGRGGVVDDTLIAALLSNTRDPAFAVAGWLLRWVTYLGALVAAGGALFLLLVARRRRVESVVSLVRWAALAGIVGSLLQVPVFAAETTGLGWSVFLSRPAMAGAVTSSLALAGLVRVAALATIATAVGRKPPWWSMAGVAGVVLADLLTGHTRTSEPAWLVIGADAVHVLSVAVWFGGLAALALSLRSARADDDLEWGAHIVGRFSTVAAWSMAALAVGGLALAWILVGAPHALTSTTYGWTLVAKLVMVGLVLVVALYNNRVLVPAVTRPLHDSTVPSNGPGNVIVETRVLPEVGWGRLGRTVRMELAGLVLVMAATALLVNLQPAADAAGVSGPFSTHVPFGDFHLEVVVDPNRVGTNEIHVYIRTAGGLSTLATGQAEIELRLPAEEIGPITRPLQPAGAGHYLHVGPELAIPGEWIITVRQRVGEFEELTADVTARVNP